MPKTSHKRGDTFRRRFTLTKQGVAEPLDDYTVASELRQRDGTLVHVLTVTKQAETGAIEIYAAPADTANWPLTFLEWDIQFTDSSGDVMSSTTIDIEVTKDVTGAA